MTYDTSMSIAILVNVFLLLVESYPQDMRLTSFLHLANMGFLWLFTIDMVLQMVGRGLKEYFTNNWYRLDFFVVFVSWVTVIYDIQAGIQAARAFRLLRVLMLFKWAGMMRAIIMVSRRPSRYRLSY
jgi:hypothetical protein